MHDSSKSVRLDSIFGGKIEKVSQIDLCLDRNVKKEIGLSLLKIGKQIKDWSEDSCTQVFNGLFCFSTFNWSVPFCSYLLMVILLIGTILLYLIPMRYILLAWGEYRAVYTIMSTLYMHIE